MAPRDIEYEERKLRELIELVKGTLDGDHFRFSPVCDFCRHNFRSGVRTCAAFPRGIPDTIYDGQNLHSSPFAGDNGVQFEFDLSPYFVPPLKGTHLAVLQALEQLVEAMGFIYHNSSGTFYRMRGELADVFFF
jgi:hypothetical protein